MYRDQPGVCREPVKGEKISVDDIMKTKDKRSRSYLKVWEEGEDGEWDKLGTFESRSNKTTKWVKKEEQDDGEWHELALFESPSNKKEQEEDGESDQYY